MLFRSRGNTRGVPDDRLRYGAMRNTSRATSSMPIISQALNQLYHLPFLHIRYLKNIIREVVTRSLVGRTSNEQCSMPQYSHSSVPSEIKSHSWKLSRIQHSARMLGIPSVLPPLTVSPRSCRTRYSMQAGPTPWHGFQPQGSFLRERDVEKVELGEHGTLYVLLLPG